MTLAAYVVREPMNDGRFVIIRPPKPGERADCLAAISPDGLTLPRVPAVNGDLSEQTTDVSADFVGRVVLIGELDQGGESAIVGAGHYVLVGQHKAQLALAVVHEYQGRGIGTQLVRHLVGLASAAHLKEIVADVSPNNMATRKILAKFGFRKARGRDPKLVHFVLPIL